MGNPVFGSSWEGLVIENILSTLRDWLPFFYRSAAGDEIDLVLVNGERVIAIECKASASPVLTKGFWKSLEVIKPEKAFVIVPVVGTYPLKQNVTVCGLADFLGKI